MHASRIVMVLLVVTVANIWSLQPALAETESEKTLSPYFFVENGDPLVDDFPLKATGVKVNIGGVIADVVITQIYTNEGSRPINARYVFPASTRAAVHGMTMRIGDNLIKAQIKEREAAQKQFDQAKKEGKSASLLEQQRPNVFTMNVANVMPDDTVEIELRYTELLVPTDGVYEFIYPTVVGPRYTDQPETEALETDEWIQNPYLQEGETPPTTFDIAVNLSTGIPLQDISCRSHETRIDWQGESIAAVSLADPEEFGGDRDFVLQYRLTGQKIESGLMLYEGRDENFFLMMIQPPERVLPEDIPPREYIFVVDVSGSMGGFPLNTAKKLLGNLIGSLRPTDRFNVVLFAGASQLMAPVSVSATQTHIQEAMGVIDQQRGGGGTELYAALKRSLDLPRDENVSRTVLIITDGYIGAEKDVFELIQKNLNRTNVFAFGIGSSVNRYLIEGMAKAGQGEPFVVLDPSEARRTAGQFREYVEAPLLTQISVAYKGFDAYDVEPVSIPDLFARRPVILFGKWRGEPRGNIEFSGKSGRGDYLQTIDVETTKALDVNSALPYLWARSRISRLSDFNPRQLSTDNRVEITSIGLTYNLLTAYTSFIAVHEVVRNTEGPAEDLKQPLSLPRGVSNLAVGGSMSNVPEPELFWLLGILAVVFIAKVVFRKIIEKVLC